MEVYKKLDIFGKSVTFNAAGRGQVNSCLGATLTLLVTVVTIAYAWTRLNVMLNYEDTRY